MKKIIGVILLCIATFFIGWEIAGAIQTDVWRSSDTRTAETTLNLCPGFSTYTVTGGSITYGNKGVLHGVCVNAGVAGSSVTLYASSGTATNPIASVATSTPTPCYFYDVLVSSGLTYTSPGTADITILYQCY